MKMKTKDDYLMYFEGPDSLYIFEVENGHVVIHSLKVYLPAAAL